MSVFISVEAGLRKSELLALKWKHVDFKYKIIHVLEAWKDGRKIKGLPKWDKTRKVPISEILENELREYFENSVYCGDEDYVICWSDGSYIGPRSFNNWLDKALEKLEIDKDKRNLGHNPFRHTCATRMIQRGVPVEVVQAILGHSEKKMTKNYTHLQADYVVSQVRKYM